MKNIIFFSCRIKPLSLCLFLLFSLTILTTQFACKDETVSPSKIDQSIVSRDEDPLDLLGISCLPDSIYEVCDSIPTTIDSMLITLPNYPGCIFYISFEYYDCIKTSGHHFYHIGNFEVIYHNCPAFTSALNAAYAAGGASLAAFVENFDHDVFLQIKINL